MTVTRATLKDVVAQFIVPQRDKPKRFDGDVPWCRIEDIDGMYLDGSKTGKHVSQQQIVEMPLRLFPESTVLVSCSADLGRCAIVARPLVTNQTFIGLVPGEEVIPEFLYYYMSHKADALNRLARGATIKYLSRKHFEAFLIEYPSVPVQKRIATILDAADALRAKRRESIEQLDSLVQATFLEMFGDPVTNPKGWPSQAVDRLVRLVRGSSPRPKGDSRFYGGPVPRLMVADITRDGFCVTPMIDSLTAEGAERSRPVPAGTVVMAVSGDVGVVATVAVDCCVHDGFVAFLDLDESVVQPFFLMLQLHLLKVTHDRRKAGAIFQNLTTTDVKSMEIMAPPLALQTRFASIVESIEHQKARLKAHLAELDTLFASLQSRAFNGELVA